MNKPTPVIGVSAWTFNHRFKAKDIEHPEFFQIVSSLGITAVELIANFLESYDKDYLAGIKRAADATGVKIANIAIDDHGFDLSSPDLDNRLEAIKRTVALMDAAVILGSPNVRNNTGGQDHAACTESFSTLAYEAGKRGLTMLIEAHGGFSSNAARLLPLVDAVQVRYPGKIGVIPDFGNVATTPQRDRYAQIRDMAPYAVLVHPKMHNFDADGNQPEWDTARLVKILLDAGFSGEWIVEYEGSGDEPVAGLEKSFSLLRRCFAQ